MQLYTPQMRVRTYHLCQAALFIFGILCIVLSLKLSTYRFGSSDFSEMIDSGWRILNGQVPGRDFVCTFPPSLYLFVATLYKHFGVTWHSLALGEALFFAVFCLLGMRLAGLLRSVSGTTDALFVFCFYFVGQTIPLISINLPWHSSIAESVGCYTVLTTFVMLRRKPLSTMLRVELFLHLVLGFTILILSKPNTAYPVLCVCITILLLDRCSRMFVWGSLLVALAGASAILATAHISLLGMLAGYSGLQGRLIPHPLVYGIGLEDVGVPPVIGLSNFCVYAIIAPVFTAFAVQWWRRRSDLRKRPDALLAFMACAIGILGMATNFDLKLIDTPLFLFGIALFTISDPGPHGLIRSRLIWTVVPLVYFCLLNGVARQRVQSIGLWADDDCGPRVVMHDSFFGTFHNCAVFGSVMHEADRAVATVPEGQHIFFGPSLEFLYARDHIQSPLHLPLWWHPGTSYPVSHTNEIVHAWSEDHFDTVIFVHNLLVNIPPAILDQVRENYVQLPGTSTIDVYKLRDSH